MPRLDPLHGYLLNRARAFLRLAGWAPSFNVTSFIAMSSYAHWHASPRRFLRSSAHATLARLSQHQIPAPTSRRPSWSRNDDLGSSPTSTLFLQPLTAQHGSSGPNFCARECPSSTLRRRTHLNFSRSLHLFQHKACSLCSYRLRARSLVVIVHHYTSPLFGVM
ncbi:hypothetical protein MVEN_01446000 [Mycena venus]|uniref:Uncharacterized protein n=1 Tax=Mycena venus TaxID=2733690 RepID=A0A8H6XUR7_9AGAR|nr:hypothetical protein MVEN_01446000 [Mycena venus]